ncbi:putative F-box protein At5g55150 [Rutidosis leptorrhynchoides]|uniref:putative F-box protein At5g55150 n=1 Tax=Rutidosis leptorrhynchoides TaxID=125765 RepID=UPI003A9913DD
MDYFEDYFNFSGVCKSWYSIAVQAVKKIEVSYSNGLPSRLSSLLFGEKKEDVEFRELFFLSNNSIRKIRLPEAYGKLYVSSSGWLVTEEIRSDYATKLINPFSREIIDLPNMFEYFDYDDRIRKVLFSRQIPVLVVLWGCTKLCFCRIGDVNWTSFETSSCGAIHDITYYDGRVYHIDDCYRLKSCDARGNDLVVVDVSQLPKCFHSKELELVYILGLDDGMKKLLVVIRQLLTILTQDDIDGRGVQQVTYKTKNFRVFEYDLEDGKWSKVNDLVKKTLFLGFGSSFCVEDTSGVINDEHDKLYRNKNSYNSKIGAEWDMGIYRMCDGTIEPHFIGESCSEVGPPIWLQSM